MTLSNWISNNYIEIFGAVAGIVYVFLEIRQNIWLWPVGIVTSAVYIWVFFTHKIYADMSLQGYYLVISCLGWYWWAKGGGQGAPAFAEATAREEGGEGENGRGRDSGIKVRIVEEQGDKKIHGNLAVTRLGLKLAIRLLIIFVALFAVMYMLLVRFTDSPVPGWDSFITSLSIVATWMLARKIYEHWFLWIMVNTVSSILFFTRDLFPTVLLYMIYCVMSFVGLRAWKGTITEETVVKKQNTF